MIEEHVLSPDLVHLIRKNTFKTEENRALPEEVLNALYKEDALRITVPKECGGGEWSLLKIVKFFEALAQADGNVGWVVNLGAGANMFSGYMEKEVAQSLFGNEKVWCAGSGAPSGKAQKTKGGYLLSGRWKYASGAAHATYFTANAMIYDENGMQSEDSSEFLSFIFPREAVTIYDTWNTTGLRATSSHEFSVRHLFVPEKHTFSLLHPSDYVHSPLYRFPFERMAVINMACMPIGMGMHFIECYQSLIETKKPLNDSTVLKDIPRIRELSQRAISPFLLARKQMYELLQEVWNCYEDDTKPTLEALDNLEESARYAAEKARKMLFDLYPVCGMNMVFPTNELNKIWRDMSVASQHYLLFP